jgi:hypothetical protein
MEPSGGNWGKPHVEVVSVRQQTGAGERARIRQWRAFLARRRAARTEPGDTGTSGRGGALKMGWTKPGPVGAGEVIQTVG